MIGWETLINRTYKHEKMTRNKEDDDLGKTPPQPPVSIPPSLPARLART